MFVGDKRSSLFSETLLWYRPPARQSVQLLYLLLLHLPLQCDQISNSKRRETRRFDNKYTGKTTYIHIYINTYTHTHTHIYIYNYIVYIVLSICKYNTRAHTRTHAHTHTHKHTHTHTHIYIYIFVCVCVLASLHFRRNNKVLHLQTVRQHYCNTYAGFNYQS